MKLDIQLEKRDEKLTKTLAGMKDEILTSNDKLIQRFDKLDKEVTMSLANYDRLSRKVTLLEKTVTILAQKAGIDFNPLELEGV